MTHTSNWIFIVIMLQLAIIAIGSTWYTNKDIRSKAGSNQATLSVKPNTQSMPPERSFQLWLDADAPVAFIRTELSFDPMMITLTHEPTIDASVFDRVIKQSTLDEANATGIYHLTIAISPTNKELAPTGTFKIASFLFTPNTTTPNVTTTINISNATSQLVNTSGSQFTLAVNSASISLNSTISPTGAPSVTPTQPTVPTITPGSGTPSVTPKPSFTPTITPIPPTKTPTPIPTITASTPTPTPPAFDLTAPVVTFLSPKDNAIVSSWFIPVKTKALDPSGISTIKIYRDNSLIKTCSNTTTCNTYLYTWKLKSGEYSLTATATDKSSQMNTGSTTITVIR